MNEPTKQAKSTKPDLQGTLFDLQTQPHKCGQPCQRMPCPECAELWREHEAVLQRVGGGQTS